MEVEQIRSSFLQGSDVAFRILNHEVAIKERARNERQLQNALHMLANGLHNGGANRKIGNEVSILPITTTREKRTIISTCSQSAPFYTLGDTTNGGLR